MNRYFALWFVLITVVLGVGCTERPDPPKTGVVRSAGIIILPPPGSVTLDDFPDPSQEGKEYTLTATVDSEPHNKAAFAYDCDPRVTDYRDCKGQFGGVGSPGTELEFAL